MIRQRVRIRFQKEGDLRLIGHRDLVRVFERAVRRARIKVGMSEGYHPKARLSFPLALSVGIASRDEVMELELSESVSAEKIEALLKKEMPQGLEITSVELMPTGSAKAQVDRVVYEIPLPPAQQTAAQSAATELMQMSECWIEKAGRSQSVDLRSTLNSLDVQEGSLQFEQQVIKTAAAGPRDVLEAMGLGSLERDECLYLTRTAVQLVTDNP